MDQNMGGNHSLKNQVENLTNKFHIYLDKPDIKPCCSSKIYVERQNLRQPSPSRNHDHAIEITENTSTDASVTRPFDISDKEDKNEDDTTGIPPASILRW